MVHKHKWQYHSDDTELVELDPNHPHHTAYDYRVNYVVFICDCGAIKRIKPKGDL